MIIDVSSLNGRIDWDKVKEFGVDTAIIRCGYGKNIKKQDDRRYYENVDGAIANGIKVGVYLTSYAENETSAVNEAEHTLRLIDGVKEHITEPVYIACELEETADTSASICKAFCEKIEEAGFRAGICATESWWRDNLKDVDGYSKWVISLGDIQPNGDIWQYTNHGKVDGIQGKVNLDKKIESQSEPTPVVVVSPKEEYIGEYIVDSKSGLNLRVGAGKTEEAIGVIPYGGTVICAKGDTIESNGDTWVKVTADINGKSRIGFCMALFLRRK